MHSYYSAPWRASQIILIEPSDYLPSDYQTQDPHVLRAIGRAWGWRRRMDAGEFATIQELAEAVGLAERHVSRQLRLAYLAPEVLKRLTCGREVLAVSLYDLCFMAGEAGGEQFERVFDWSLMPRPQRSVTRACFLMERTFVQSAANAGSEPTPDLLILCCVRSQRGNCCGRVNFYTAARRENRSFIRITAKLRSSKAYEANQSPRAAATCRTGFPSGSSQRNSQFQSTKMGLGASAMAFIRPAATWGSTAHCARMLVP